MKKVLATGAVVLLLAGGCNYGPKENHRVPKTPGATGVQTAQQQDVTTYAICKEVRGAVDAGTIDTDTEEARISYSAKKTGVNKKVLAAVSHYYALDKKDRKPGDRETLKAACS